MTKSIKKVRNTKSDAISALQTLRQFIGQSQLSAICEGCQGEEKQYFFDKAVEMADLVSNMPETYEQDGKGKQAVVFLHYFRGNMDWYITEKDCDPEGEGQIQAFGMADLGYGGELGYISIQELILNNIELDMHFTPKTLAEIKASK